MSHSLIDLDRTLQRLSIRRPIFHSEADFQHELAWEIRIIDPELSVRIERPFPGRTSGAIDLVVSDGRLHHAIELKYLTRKFVIHHEGEDFQLKEHSAQDLRRYDICRDVERMEEFGSAPDRTASVIAVTNDPYYWSGRHNSGTIAEAFDVSEGRLISGELRWADHTGAGTMKNREKPINICRSHSISWKDYSDLGQNGKFRYMHVLIPSEPINSGNREMSAKDEFREELHKRLGEAQRRGARELILSAGELHRALGGYPGKSHRMPSCCDVMRDEMGTRDNVVSSPPSGRGASLTIRYSLPR